MKQSMAVCGLAGMVLLAAAFVLRGQGGAAPADKDKPRTIQASGEAVVLARPDSARVYMGVTTIAEKVAEAREANARKVKQVMDALTALKIPGARTKTSDVEVTLLQSQDREQARLPEVLGFRVQQTFTVLMEEQDAVKLATLAGKVLDTGLENGVTQIQTVHFFKKDDVEQRRQAMTQAVQDAVLNAKALAAGLPVNVLDTVAIDQGSNPLWGDGLANVQNNVFLGGAGSGGADTSLVAGNLEIRCRVTVRCTY